MNTWVDHLTAAIAVVATVVAVVALAARDERRLTGVDARPLLASLARRAWPLAVVALAAAALRVALVY